MPREQDTPTSHPFYSDPLSLRDDSNLPHDLQGNMDDAGRRAGTWLSHWPDGAVKLEVPFEDGRAHGVVRWLDGNGREARREAWQNGRRHGPGCALSADGVREEYEFVDGKVHGERRITLADGTVVLRECFADDQPHGESLEYDDQGTLRVKRGFFEGVPHGAWSLCDDRGRTLVTRNWFHGVPHGKQQLAGRDEEWTHGVRTRGRFRWTDGESDFGPVPWARMGVFALVVGAGLFLWTGATATLMALGLAIAVHEVGHLWAAKFARIPIAVYRVGMGPRVCSFLCGATFVDIRAIPLFGFVYPAGVRPSAMTHVNERLGFGPPATGEVDPHEAPQPITAPPGRRSVFLMGGVVMNLLAAWLVRWLAVMPDAPLRAAAWVFSVAGRIIVRVPEFVLSLFAPGTYTSGEGGLIAAGHKSVHSLDAALHMFVVVNVVLAAFNAFPIPPLDGFKVTEAGAEAMLGASRAARVLRPLRVLGVFVIVLFVLSGLWFIGRDLYSVIRG